jgi:hypothetical protein
MSQEYKYYYTVRSTIIYIKEAFEILDVGMSKSRESRRSNALEVFLIAYIG